MNPRGKHILLLGFLLEKIDFYFSIKLSGWGLYITFFTLAIGIETFIEFDSESQKPFSSISEEKRFTVSF